MLAGKAPLENNTPDMSVDISEEQAAETEEEEEEEEEEDSDDVCMMPNIDTPLFLIRIIRMSKSLWTQRRRIALETSGLSESPWTVSNCLNFRLQE